MKTQYARLENCSLEIIEHLDLVFILTTSLYGLHREMLKGGFHLHMVELEKLPIVANVRNGRKVFPEHLRKEMFLL